MNSVVVSFNDVEQKIADGEQKFKEDCDAAEADKGKKENLGEIDQPKKEDEDTADEDITDEYREDCNRRREHMINKKIQENTIKYIYCSWKWRSVSSKFLRVVYKFFRVLYVALWFYFVPFAAIYMSYALPYNMRNNAPPEPGTCPIDEE